MCANINTGISSGIIGGLFNKLINSGLDEKKTAELLSGIIEEKTFNQAKTSLSQLHGEIAKEYINPKQVIDWSTEVLKYTISEELNLLCNFYKAVCGDNYKETNEYISAIVENCEKYKDFIRYVLKLSILYLRRETVELVCRLLERANEKGCFANSQEYADWSNFYESEVQKVYADIYNLNADYKVFIAYKSEDIDKVIEICKYLEERKLKCFYAERNLRKTVAGDYKNSLNTALEHCESIVFISSYASRHNGDALREGMELDYVRTLDRNFAKTVGVVYRPYSDIPDWCKLPRAEFLIDEYKKDEKETLPPILESVFDGKTWIRNKNTLAKYLDEQISWRRGEIAAQSKQREKSQEKQSATKSKTVPQSENAELIPHLSKSLRNPDGVSRKQQEKDSETKQLQDIEEPRAQETKRYNYEDFDIEGTILEKYKGKDTEVVIPNGVTSIGAWAFDGCSGLKNITIPSSVTSICDNAFDGCSGLTSITIPSRVTSIGEFAFSGCSGLTSVTIPNSVTSIGLGAFYGCSGLTSITIPGSVTSIGLGAFYGCSGLTSITIPGSVTSIGNEAFFGCSSLESITFKGTKMQWIAISKGSLWNYNTGNYTIHYVNGDIKKS